jgi:DNA polymerase-3 subunit epsilon
MWHHGPMLAFDSETTGVDVEADRIVTAAAVVIHPGQPAATTTWLADPGIDIPDEATTLHGITTDHARAHGRPAREVAEMAAAALAEALAAGTPVVTMNGSYDLTILDRECRRHGVATLDDRLAGGVRPVVDIRVLDKQIDRYRRGSRRLDALCRHYNVDHGDAHDCVADALAAARIAWRICQRHPAIAAMPLAELHTAQITWAAEQAASLADYFRRQGNPEADTVDGTWPIRLLA